MKKYVLLFRSCLIMAMIGTAALFMVVFTSAISADEHRLIFKRILGAVFWTSFAAEIILIYKTDLQRKIISLIEGYETEKSKAGIFSFSRNIYGKTADIAMIASAAAIILMIFFNVHIKTAVIFCVCLLYFSAVMHCIFNGKNYRFLCDHSKEGEGKHEEE